VLDKAYVRQKLVSLIQYLDEIAPLTQITLAEYRADFVRRHAVEKLIELIVEFASDINRHLVEGAGKAAPQTYYNTFEEVAHLKVISVSLAARLGATTGLRNRLVHGYEDVDDELVHQALKPLARNYRKYVIAIEEYLRRVS